MAKNMLFGKPRDKVIKHPGAFSEASRKAKMSTSAFATQILAHPDAFTTTRIHQASLAKAFTTMRKMKKAKKK